LGIDYHHPSKLPVPDFSTYIQTIRNMLVLRPGQSLHIEPGRSVVAQCGSLISRVLYVKKGLQKEFAILDAGMTELIRPALYQAYHKIENISSEEPEQKYDVVGPICESSDSFGKQVVLNKTQRGDLIAIRSAGAYAEIMASNYNLRPKAPSYFSDDMKR
jgi:diaminopimelate decarboxylase